MSKCQENIATRFADLRTRRQNLPTPTQEEAETNLLSNFAARQNVLTRKENNMFVYFEEGLQKYDGSINESLVYYLTNYRVEFALVTKKPKTALNQWDVSELVSKAGLPRQVADNCVFGVTIDTMIDLGLENDIVFTDDSKVVDKLQGKFRCIDTISLAAYCA